MSLREARERAARELASVREGEADPLERRREGREAPTVGEGLDRFLDEYAPERIRLGRLSPRTLQTYRNQAKLYIRPALGPPRARTHSLAASAHPTRRTGNARLPCVTS